MRRAPPRPLLCAAALCPVLLLLAAAPGRAHDLWIEPTSFAPRVGAAVGLRLRVGQGFRGEPVPRDPALLEAFVAAGPEGSEDLPGVDGFDPAGFLRPRSPGLRIVAYRSAPVSATLDAVTFERYLAEEGLEPVLGFRRAAAQTAENGRERFSRCAKSLLDVRGPLPSAGEDRPLGLRLELVLGRRLEDCAPGEPLPVRLLFDGAPLAGARVAALSRDERAEDVAARTGPDGRVALALPHGGVWLVKSVHMVPAAPGTGADWESFWASLTFDLAPAPGGR